MEPTALIWANTQSTNVCVIDWHALALYNFMLTAETHTWLVAEYASYFVRYLVTLGAILENIVVAGHSLGANIAGFLGKLLGSGQLGMILGKKVVEVINTHRNELKLIRTDSNWI